MIEAILNGASLGCSRFEPRFLRLKSITIPHHPPDIFKVINRHRSDLKSSGLWICLPGESGPFSR
jgi:hypothetical protein